LQKKHVSDKQQGAKGARSIDLKKRSKKGPRNAQLRASTEKKKAQNQAGTKISPNLAPIMKVTKTESQEYGMHRGGAMAAAASRRALLT
jgi:hypothetical protein